MADPISTLGGSGSVLPIAAPTFRKSEPKTAPLETDPASSSAVQGTSETAPALSTPSQGTDLKRLQEAAKVVEAHLSALSTHLQFGVDKDTNLMTLKVIDSDTQKVIREYPPEAVLKMAKYIQSNLDSKETGLLVDLKH